MHVILIGPQGSGKGTQSERVRTRLNLASIATGELFRAAIKGGTELGHKVQAVYDRGDLVPDDLTVALVEQRLDQLATEQARGAQLEGALYDGFPRTIAQADALSRVLSERGEQLTAVVAIDVPRQKLVERLAGRRVCSSCGRVYNVISDPPAVDMYDIETAPLVGRYQEQGLVERVDGDRPIDEVTESIVAAIQKRAER
jgi:adenylate kinase